MRRRKRISNEQQVSSLEQIDAFLAVVRTLDPLPESCFPTCLAVYEILDTLLARYARLYYISQRVTSVIRRGLTFFPDRALEPVVKPLLDRLAMTFDQTGHAEYLWILGKVNAKFANVMQALGGENVAAYLGQTFESCTQAVSKLLQTKVVVEIPDGGFCTASPRSGLIACSDSHG